MNGLDNFELWKKNNAYHLHNKVGFALVLPFQETKFNSKEDFLEECLNINACNCNWHALLSSSSHWVNKNKKRQFQSEFISSNGKYQNDVLVHTIVIHSKRITHSSRFTGAKKEQGQSKVYSVSFFVHSILSYPILCFLLKSEPCIHKWRSSYVIRLFHKLSHNLVESSCSSYTFPVVCQ